MIQVCIHHIYDHQVLQNLVLGIDYLCLNQTYQEHKIIFIIEIMIFYLFIVVISFYEAIASKTLKERPV